MDTVKVVEYINFFYQFSPIWSNLLRTKANYVYTTSEWIDGDTSQWAVAWFSRPQGPPSGVWTGHKNPTSHTHFAVNHNRLFIHFKGHFPGEPGLADTRRYGIVEFNVANTRMSPFWILLELRMMDVVVNTGAIKRAKLHLHQAFYSRHNWLSSKYNRPRPRQSGWAIVRYVEKCHQSRHNSSKPIRVSGSATEPENAGTNKISECDKCWTALKD